MLTHQISLIDYFYFLKYRPMFLEITCFPACEATNFESNIGFFVKEFYYMTEKSGKKFKYFKNTKNF